MVNPSLQLRITQKLAMAPQLQQAIRLLQLNRIELRDYIQDLVETNPLLDHEENAEQPIRQIRKAKIHPSIMRNPKPAKRRMSRITPLTITTISNGKLNRTHGLTMRAGLTTSRNGSLKTPAAPHCVSICWLKSGLHTSMKLMQPSQRPSSMHLMMMVSWPMTSR